MKVSNQIDGYSREALIDYFNSLETSKLASSTMKKYQNILQNFFIDSQIPLDELSSDDVFVWLEKYYLDKSKRTIILVISVLRCFFNFCKTEEYIEKKIIKKRWCPRMPENIPRYLIDKEIARLRIQADFLNLRDKTLIEFLLTSGCRRSEVSGLNVNDINIDNRTAVVNGKGNQVRTVHFSEKCAYLLKECLKEHPHEDALFLNKYGKRLSSKGIYRITIKAGKMSKLPHRLSPHILRHSFATFMLARGANLFFIASELGHKNMNNTRIYAKVLHQDLIDEYRRIKE